MVGEGEIVRLEEVQPCNPLRRWTMRFEPHNSCLMPFRLLYYCYLFADVYQVFVYFLLLLYYHTTSASCCHVIMGTFSAPLLHPAM